MTPTKTDSKRKTKNIKFLIVEKNGDIKESEIKEELICAEELSKKCKFKKVDGYLKRTEWGYSFKNDIGVSSKIVVEMWAKDDGMANHENKYEFPPPLDQDLYFGACALVARDYKNSYTDLTEELWDDIYEYLFGGFESLVANEEDDDDEYDELDDIPMSKKTRDGYLKDGFVVDNNRGDDINGDDDSCSDSDEDDEDDGSEIDESSDDDEICEESDEESDDGEAECYGKKTKKGNSNIKNKNKNVIIEKNKDRISVSNSRIVVGNENKSSNIKDKNKEKDKNKSKDKKNKEKDDDYDNGWKTDESSELSEEEYSYSR